MARPRSHSVRRLPGRASRAELRGVVRAPQERLRGSADVAFRLHTAGEDPSDVAIVIEAKLAPASVEVLTDAHLIQAGLTREPSWDRPACRARRAG